MAKNPQAFPKATEAPQYEQNGMTLRDYFAAKAMNGLLADLPKTMYGLNWKDNLVQASYEIADAMLKERENA